MAKKQMRLGPNKSKLTPFDSIKPGMKTAGKPNKFSKNSSMFAKKFGDK